MGVVPDFEDVLAISTFERGVMERRALGTVPAQSTGVQRRGQIFNRIRQRTLKGLSQ